MPKLISALTLPCQLEDETSPIGIANLLFCGRLVRDRFNVLNQYSRINQIDTVDKIPEPSPTPIGELMDRRAEELIGKGSISTQQSGGVDSTSLLLALIKNGVSKEDLQILYDTNSVDEYPKLYLWLKENGQNMKPVTNWFDILSTVDTDIITNGQCADQLFGSVFFHTSPELYTVSMEELLTKVSVPSGSIPEKKKQEAIEVYKNFAKEKFGLDLTCAAELGWFINFTVKQTYVKDFNLLYLCNTKNWQKTKVFYDTEYFQSQALNNYPNIKKCNIYSSDASQYKRPLKEYCNEIFPDEEYLEKKTKKPSQNASQNRTMYRKMKIVLRSDEGYQMFEAPKYAPNNQSYEKILEGIFTKYRK